MGTDALQPPADGDEEMGRKPQGFFSPFFHPSLGLGRRLTPRQDCVGQGCCPGLVWGPRGGGAVSCSLAPCHRWPGSHLWALCNQSLA